MGMYNGVSIDLQLHPETSHTVLKVLLMMSLFTEEGDAARILEFMRQNEMDTDHAFFKTANWSSLVRSGQDIKSFAPHEWELPKLACLNGYEWSFRVRSYTKCTSGDVALFLDWLKPHIYGTQPWWPLAKVWYEETATEEYRVISLVKDRVKTQTIYARNPTDILW